MGQILTASAVLLCPHGGKVSAVPSNLRAKAAGGFILSASDTFLIAGCPFFAGAVYHPCVTVRWIVPGLRSSAAGAKVLTTDSVGLCLAADNAPQGTVMVAVAQPRVGGQ
jgi:hypothetical protein